jgi:hypothetical protein
MFVNRATLAVVAMFFNRAVAIFVVLVIGPMSDMVSVIRPMMIIVSVDHPAVILGSM